MSVFGLRERNIMKDSKYRAFSVKNLLITFACIANGRYHEDRQVLKRIFRIVYDQRNEALQGR